MTDIYVATDGSDNNAGTIAAPIATWSEARERVGAGDTVFMRGGVYTGQFLLYNDDGDPDAPITVEAYEGEDVVFDQGGWTSRVRAHHIRLRGLTFTNGTKGLVLPKADTYDVRLYDCEAYDNVGDGFAVSEEAHDVEFYNCIGHHNYDEPISSEKSNRNADGFNVTLRAYNVRFYRCDAYHNVDDGFDTNKGGFGMELYDCRAWDNGLNPNEQPVGNGVGIKMQNGRGNTLETDPGNPSINARCVTWNNVSDGQRFYRTGGTCYAVNCTSFNNGDDDFQTNDYTGGPNDYYYINCISGAGGAEIKADNLTERRNTWNIGISNPLFVQASDHTTKGFARLRADSPCIDAGSIDTEGVTIEYEGSGPDLGAYQYSTSLRVRDGGAFVYGTRDVTTTVSGGNP